jgi:hypothetical protein
MRDLTAKGTHSTHNCRKRSDLFLDTLGHMISAEVLTFEKLTA